VDKTRSLSEEIATRQRSIDFYSIGMQLPNPDPVLKKMGKDITIYKELRSDPIVHGCITSRKAGTKKLLWEIDRGKAKSRQAKFLTDAIKALPVDRIIGQMLNAPLYGYQPMEVMWNADYTPADVVAKPPHWFLFDESNNFRFRTKSNWSLGEELPEKKFILARNDADYENPYGFPILSTCFWPVTFRKGGFKFWVTFTEKFGMPFIVGKQPRGTSKDETEAFADMLELMITDAIAVIPDDASVEIPETKITGSADLYDKLITACKSEISVALLGHSGGALSTPGKLGGEDQAVGVRDDIVDGDTKIVEECFNTLIDWTAEYKFAERGERPRFYLYEEEDVDLDQSTRDKNLADTKQVLFKKPYFMKTYGFEEEDIDVIDPPPAPPAPSPLGGEGGVRGAQFSAKSAQSADASQAAIDDALANLDPAELQKQMEGVLKPVIDLINSGSSYEEIMKNLVEAYPKMDSTSIEEMLARAIFVSEMWGRINAKNQ
jgi:phage gp29-like protein